MKCSFCEHLLACRHCGKAFRPRQSETFIGAYQPDMQISCPECQHVLICKTCGFVYGATEGEEGNRE